MGSKAASVLSRQLRLRAATASATPAAPRHDSLVAVKELTTRILNDVRLGRLSKAISDLFYSRTPLPSSVYAHLFRICSSSKAIVETRKLESHLVSSNPNPPVFLLNRAIEAYGRCNCVESAETLFDEMPRRDGGSWNAMITAYLRNGRTEDALETFAAMISEGLFASEVTFASVLASCGVLLEIWLSRQVHGLILKYGFRGNVILESSIVDVYGKCGAIVDARRMFDEIESPNEVSWNVIVRRYLELGEGSEAIEMFVKMVRSNLKPMSFTVSNAVLACSSIGGLGEGLQIHGFSVKINADEDEVVSNTLIDMYAKCGDLESARMVFKLQFCKNVISYTSMVSALAMSGKMGEARELFDEMPQRTVVSWNVMLAGYTRASDWEKALEFLISMRRKTRDVDRVTLGLFLNVCAAIPDMNLGKQVHGYAYRHGLASDVSVGNSLLDMYGKCGNLLSARSCFRALSGARDVVSWNALLSSYARLGMSEHALLVFGRMLGEAEPSKFTFGTMLAACANIPALGPGKQIHAYMVRHGHGPDTDAVAAGALVDMYSKCRCAAYAARVFEGCRAKDAILVNSMIAGCLHNGMGGRVAGLADAMEREGVRPDHDTFTGALRACVGEGNVELGRKIFESMSEKYFLVPHLEHYECIIELYGENGFGNELEEFIGDLPFEPTAAMLIKVFDCSRRYKWLKLGEWAADRLNEMNPPVPFRFEIVDDR